MPVKNDCLPSETLIKNCLPCEIIPFSAKMNTQLSAKCHLALQSIGAHFKTVLHLTSRRMAWLDPLPTALTAWHVYPPDRLLLMDWSTNERLVKMMFSDVLCLSGIPWKNTIEILQLLHDMIWYDMIIFLLHSIYRPRAFNQSKLLHAGCWTMLVYNDTFTMKFITNFAVFMAPPTHTISFFSLWTRK